MPKFEKIIGSKTVEIWSNTITAKFEVFGLDTNGKVVAADYFKTLSEAVIFSGLTPRRK